ncbi:MAG: hypothetical protein ACKO40_01885, partial [Planctomycetaceae bacterium]
SVETDAAAGGEVAEQLKAELANYEAGKPWRERQEMAEDGEAAASPAVPAPKAPATAARDAKPRRPFDD